MHSHNCMRFLEFLFRFAFLLFLVSGLFLGFLVSLFIVCKLIFFTQVLSFPYFFLFNHDYVIIEIAILFLLVICYLILWFSVYVCLFVYLLIDSCLYFGLSLSFFFVDLVIEPVFIYFSMFLFVR